MNETERMRLLMESARRISLSPQPQTSISIGKVPFAIAVEVGHSDCRVVIGESAPGIYGWEIWKVSDGKKVKKFVYAGPYDDLESAREDGLKILQWCKDDFGPSGLAAREAGLVRGEGE